MWSAPADRVTNLPSIRELFFERQYSKSCVDRAELILDLERMAHADKDKLPADDRFRYVMSLRAIVIHLERIGIDAKTSIMLSDLMTALNDLNHGIVAHFLKPRERLNRPPDSSLMWMARCSYVIAVNVLTVNAGMSIVSACEYVARTSGAVDRVAAARTVSVPNALRKWHTAFLNDEVKNDLAANSFKNRFSFVREVVRHLGSNNPRAIADHIIGYADELSSQKPPS